MTTTEKFTTLGSSTLNGAILSTDPTLVVNSAATFPTTPQFRINIDGEIMLVTAVSGTTFTVSRAVEGPNAAAGHSNGANVTEVFTAGAISQMKQDTRMSAVWTNLTSGQSPYTMALLDEAIGCDTTTGPFYIYLPASPVDGETHEVADTGLNATTYPIAVDSNGAANGIVGMSVFFLRVNGAAAIFRWNANKSVWVVR